MRVLHFFKTYWPDSFGGVERTIHAIAKGAAEHGIVSDVLSLSEAPQRNSVEFDGHIAHKAKLDFEFASTGFSRDVFRRFRLLSAKADIVHFHFPWPLMDVVHLLSRHSKPTVVTYHSDIVKQRMLLRLYRPLMFRFLGSVDHIVATSPNYLESSAVLQRFRSKTSVIPLGLDQGDYLDPESEVVETWRKRLPSRFFVFVGVLRYYKGLHVLLEAARTSGLPVVIIGDGPMKGELLEQASRQKIDNVHFLGALPDIDKTAIMKLAIALLFPSHLRSEAFGLSLVEAAMLGKPMISCEIGTGTSYVNLDGETGLVVPPENAVALAEAMLRLSGGDAATVRFGRAARQRFETHFTAGRMAQSYAALYRQIDGSRKR